VLLAHGAEVNPLTNTGKTPLHMGAEAGNLAVVKLLVSKGADISLKDAKGMTPFDLAKKGGHNDVMAAVRPKGSGGEGCCVVM
jgi:ankyrin repeat protein